MSEILERLCNVLRAIEGDKSMRDVFEPTVVLTAAEFTQLNDTIKSLREKTQYWPDNAERDAVIKYQKEEIERLRAGGCARDQSTTQYCAEAARLAAENERLRAALERVAFGKYHWEADAQEEARAALNGEEVK